MLNLRTSSSTGAEADEVIEDLLDLEPGSSYNVQAGRRERRRDRDQRSVKFTSPAAVFVNPATGAVQLGLRQEDALHDRRHREGDRFVGTTKRDVICGLGGNDRILGRGGNDLILAGAGGDRASGGNGHDRVYGNSGMTAVRQHRPRPALRRRRPRPA